MRQPKRKTNKKITHLHQFKCKTNDDFNHSQLFCNFNQSDFIEIERKFATNLRTRSHTHTRATMCDEVLILVAPRLQKQPKFTEWESTLKSAIFGDSF